MKDRGVVKLLLETGQANVHSQPEGLFGWMGLRSAAQEVYKAAKKHTELPPGLFPK